MRAPIPTPQADLRASVDGVALWIGDERAAVYDSYADGSAAKRLTVEAVAMLRAALATAPGREKA